MFIYLDDHESLRELLQDISQPERLCTVKNWRTGGQVSVILMTIVSDKTNFF